MNARLLLHVTAPLVATSLLLLAVGVGTAWYMHRLQKIVLEDLKADTSGVRAAEELEILVRETRTQLDYFLITGDRRYLNEIGPLRGETERWLATAERWSLSPEEQALTSRARRGYQRFVTDLSRLDETAAHSSRAQTIRVLIDDLVQGVQEPIHQYLDLNEEEVEKAIAENQTFASRLFFGLLLLGICGSGAGLTAGFGFARAFNRRLIQLSVPIRDAAGRLDQVVGPITFAAGTDLHELEGVLHRIAERIGAVIDRLRQSERQALQAEQLAAVGQMAAGMAHELRNPLTSMRLLVQSAQARQGSEHHRDQRPSSLAEPFLAGRDLMVMEEEIARLEEMLQSFLQFALPPCVEKKTVDVRSLVEAGIGLMAARAAAAEIRIQLACPSEPVLATVDAGQFRQVLLNLLLNAFEALGGQGSVWLTLEKRSDGSLYLKVADSGCGIPQALGSRIFSPFVTTKEAGLGLGLSICKRIVEAHNGEIMAANRPAGGAEFTLRLPPAEKTGSA